MRCCVPFCTSTSAGGSTSGGQAVSFHGFPNDIHLRAAWLGALGKQDGRLPDSAVVCSQHFLHDDIYETESGSRQVVPGAVPATVQVCMLCLDTDSKLVPVHKHRLKESYEELTGQPVSELGNLQQTLCVQCAQRLMSFSRFRDKSLRARALMMDLVQKHEIVTRKHIETIDRTKHHLHSSMVWTTLGPDHCDLHILDHTADDKQTELEDIKQEDMEPEEYTRAELLKREGKYFVKIDSDNCMLVDGGLVLVKENGTNLCDLECDPVKHESTDKCAICLEEFIYEDDYTQHICSGVKMGAHDPSQACKPLTGVSSSSAHSALQPLTSVISSSAHSALQPLTCVSSSSAHCPLQPLTDVAYSSAHAVIQLDIQELGNDQASSASVLQNWVAPLPPPDEADTIKTEEEATADANKSDSYLKEELKDFLKLNERKDDIEECWDMVDTSDKVLIEATELFEDHSIVPNDNQETNDNETQQSVIVHNMQTDAETKHSTCKECQYTCENKTKFLWHMLTHTGKTFTCEVCNKKFTRNSNLADHMRTHTGEKPFQCNSCTYKCASSSNLLVHMKTHAGEKPYQCNYCPYKYLTSYQIDRHTTTHAGEKSYPCNVCSYQGASKIKLTRHVKSHLGEKSFTCTVCIKEFARKNGLVRHMRIHSGEQLYVCDICSKEFAYVHHLNKHKLTHTSENH